MLALCIILGVLSAAVFCVWSTRHLMIRKELRRGFVLTEDAPGPPSDPPRVSVIIPAKDEAHNIELCLRSWLAQDYPDFEIIVCNDRSTDGTGRIVESLAAQDDRVRVLHVQTLPEGWCGKGHGIWRSMQIADGDWICMSDADCRQTSTRTLSVGVQYALGHDADLLSMLPKLEMKSFWENVVQPVCSGVMMIWFHPDRVNDPRKHSAYANGAFVLMRRSAYEAVGTHAAIRDVLMEDMQLARRVKDAGLRLEVVRSGRLYVVRMYTCLREILRGWTRIFLGSFGSLRRLLISLLVLIVMGLVPYAAAAVGLSLAGASTTHAAWYWACGIAGAAAVVMQLSVVWRFYRLIDGRPALAWSYPLGCAVAVAAVLWAITKHRPGSSVIWKGTRYASRADG